MPKTEYACTHCGSAKLQRFYLDHIRCLNCGQVMLDTACQLPVYDGPEPRTPLSRVSERVSEEAGDYFANLAGVEGLETICGIVDQSEADLQQARRELDLARQEILMGRGREQVYSEQLVRVQTQRTNWMLVAMLGWGLAIGLLIRIIILEASR